MKDHRFIKDGGLLMPVAEMPIDDIYAILAGHIEIEIVPLPDDPPGGDDRTPDGTPADRSADQEPGAAMNICFYKLMGTKKPRPPRRPRAWTTGDYLREHLPLIMEKTRCMRLNRLGREIAFRAIVR